MTATCPVCSAPQDAGLMCHSCTTRLERDLGDVAAIVADLEISLSKMARIGNAGSAGLARERTPIHLGAMNAGDDLRGILTKWASDIGQIKLLGHEREARFAAAYLLSHIPEIRRHPEVTKLVDQIADAIKEARRIVDRPVDWVYLGQCLVPTQDEEGKDVHCYEDVYASPGASETRCKVCGITHVVADRREWLMKQAEDRLFTVREAAQMVGNVGNRHITEDRIRGYLRRGRIVFHTANLIRLGDLLAVVVSEGEKKTA